MTETQGLVHITKRHFWKFFIQVFTQAFTEQISRTFDLVGKLLDSILLILNVYSYESSNAKNLKSRTNSYHRLYQAQFEFYVEFTDVCMPKVMLTIRPPFSYEQERSLHLKIRYCE